MRNLVHIAAGLAITAAMAAAQGTNPAGNFPPERWAKPAPKSAGQVKKPQLPQSDQPARALRAAKKQPPAAKPVPYPADHAAVETQQQGVMEPPSRPEQWPAVAPRVSYRNGMLTVVAENSMLSDVLNAIKSATGAKFDFTSGGAQERVAASIGPAPPRQVLMTLLNGSHYDYIILSSETNPAQVQSVVLTPKSNAPAGQPAVNAYNPPPQQAQPVPQISPDQAAGNDENEGFAEPADQNQDQNQEDQDNSGQTPTNQPMPNQQPQYPQIGQPVNPQQPGTNPNGDGQVKSPEQLLQELRRMQQQNQQNNPNNPQTQRPDRPQ